jgi:hypothetical protein
VVRRWWRDADAPDVWGERPVGPDHDLDAVVDLIETTMGW